MIFPKKAGYLYNCFWLMTPILIFNLLLAHKLPASFQTDVFWKNIPKEISFPENLLRTLVMILPILMPFRVSTPNQKLGLALYFTGVLVYFASWGVLIVSPQCAWSRSEIGFLAPAYTPIVWLIGIGLIGNELLNPKIPYKSWMYCVLSALFLVFHNLHTATVFFRGI
jgi:hypothetical protein